MRPSLKADSGDIVGKPFTFSTQLYTKIRHLATLSMRMETAAILTLRKVLNPELPAHQAIINASTTAMQADQAGEFPSELCPCLAHHLHSNKPPGPLLLCRRSVEFRLYTSALAAAIHSCRKISFIMIPCIEFWSKHCSHVHG